MVEVTGSIPVAPIFNYTMNESTLNELIKNATSIVANRKHDKWTIGRLISLFEDERIEAIKQRQLVLEQLKNKNQYPPAKFIGFTGSPGVGKSSLINTLTQNLLKNKPELRIGVLAIDPSSSFSGGSFLGDRKRLQFNKLNNERLFFRSQAADQELGGVSRKSYMVARLLYYLFDIVFIETVGIGQNEIEIQFLADQTILVLQPASGDQIQFLKAGIMEIPDLFVINKCEQEPATQESLLTLKTSISLARLVPKNMEEIPILCCSAINNIGITELAGLVWQATALKNNWQRKEEYYFTKWVRDEFGRQGLQKLETKSSPAEMIKKYGSFEAAQLGMLT